MSPRLAYFINAYPAISHAFIRREILALERKGFDVMRTALRGWNGKLVDSEDVEERRKTHYVLRHGMLPLLIRTLVQLMIAPRRFVQALLLAVRMGLRADRPLPYHLAYLAEACWLVQTFKKHHIEHVHAHFGTNSAEIVMLSHALGGPPYSFTVHGPLEFDRPQFLGLAEKIRRSAFVVAITSYTRSQLYRHCTYEDWEKIHVVRCGLQPEIFEYEPLPPPMTTRLVCIGRLVEQKGQRLLIEAAAKLVERRIEIHLVLVGAGPMREELQRLIDKYELRKHVELTGAIPTEQLYEELRLARGLVLPSFAEGLPMVIMEAMALRRPVISTFIAGIPELVCDGETGWLVPAGSVDHLVEAIADLLARPADELEAMGNLGFCRVRAHHSSGAETGHLARLFARSVHASQGRK